MGQPATLHFKMVEDAVSPTQWSRWRNVLVPGLVVFLFSLPVFGRLCGADPQTCYTDYPEHFNFALRMGRGGESLPHPLFHYCLLAMMGGPNGFRMATTAALLLALMWGVRASLTAFLLRSNAAVSLTSLVVLSLALGVVMPLPNWWKFPLSHEINYVYLAQKIGMPLPIWWKFPSLYLGQLSPNVWHNPTTIFTIPFVLLVFLLGNRVLESFSLLHTLALGLVMALSILAKPNYVLAFMPSLAIGLFLVFCRRQHSSVSWSGFLLRLALAFAPAVLLLAGQFVSTFGEHSVDKSFVTFAPFVVWSLYSPHIFGSFVVSTAFPLLVTASYFRKVLQDRALVLAWTTFVVATLQFALLAEVGNRFTHANFAWGAFLANHVLFVCCAAFLLRQPNSTKRLVGFSVFALHVASGLFCLARCLAYPEFVVRF